MSASEEHIFITSTNVQEQWQIEVQSLTEIVDTFHNALQFEHDRIKEFYLKEFMAKVDDLKNTI